MLGLFSEIRGDGARRPLPSSRAPENAGLPGRRSRALAEADEAGTLVAEAAHGRSVDVASLGVGIRVLAHLVGVVHVAAARPSRATAHAAGRAGTTHGATLPEDLRVVVRVEVALRRRRGALAREGAAGSEGAGGLRAESPANALEAGEAADAIGALLVHGLMGVVGEVAAVAVLDGHGRELRHGGGCRVGRATVGPTVSRCTYDCELDTHGTSDGVTGSEGGGGRLMRVGLERSPDMMGAVKLEDEGSGSKSRLTAWRCGWSTGYMGGWDFSEGRGKEGGIPL